jgi:hypothetical protein
MRHAAVVAFWILAFTGGAAAEKEAVPAPSRAKPWAFTSPHKSVPPAVADEGWAANSIDRFILAKLQSAALTPSGAADKATLLRRVTFDLTGLLPTPQEQTAFLVDSSPLAFEKLVDRLLASPAYGERMALYWLDLVRYAESDGFKADDYRPNAHKYRDYVIRAFNEDLPYDAFLRQQLAGDEFEPDNPQALIATGLHRLYPDEYNAANLEQRRQEILDDVTEVTGLAFLGLTIGCARCHDHKFDPLLQTDFFRLQAYFAAMNPGDDMPAANAAERRQYDDQLAKWESATKDIRADMDALTAAKRTALRKHALEKFRPEIQEAVLTPPEKRTPYQVQIAILAEKQLVREEKTAPTKLSEDDKKRYQELEKKLTATKPAPLPGAAVLTDIGPQAPPVHLLGGGDWRRPKEVLQPGVPVILGDDQGSDARKDLGGLTRTTGRRAALARWLTRPENPLTARVIVNRVWQQHFGVGLVATPNDFGAQGEPPTHPELLDWLAVDFVEHGWSLKYLHRMMVLSATFRQTSVVTHDDPRLAKDKENKLLWHARRRRMEGEAIRDELLQLAGDLNPRMYGPSARPKLPGGLGSYAWKPDARPEDQNRRSIYVFAKRNLRYPLFDAFDLPDMHNSCARRVRTTTAPQALLMVNSELTLEETQRWSASLLKQHGGDERALLAEAYRAAWGRPASETEIQLGVQFLDRQTSLVGSRDAAVADFCHALVNANEFIYLD